MPHRLRLFLQWFSEGLEGSCTSSYDGTQSPSGSSEVWHKVTFTGDWIFSADAKHQLAHRSQQIEVFHGTSPTSLVEILKFGGMKDGSVHLSTSHTPWCCMGADRFDAATQNAFGAQGCLVQLVVHGQRHNYQTVKSLPELAQVPPEEDWRKVFLDEAPGRIITWRGTFYMKANATEVKGFLIRDDKLEALARVSHDRKRRRR